MGLTTVLIGLGEHGNGKLGVNRLQGVSGIPRFAPAGGGKSSGFRCRFEINPVDLKAAGFGLAILCASGVASEVYEPLLYAGGNAGLKAPIGSDLEKLTTGAAGLAKIEFPVVVVPRAWKEPDVGLSACA